MHRWMRNTHLLVGLFCAAIVVIYGVSSALMAHRDWFPWRSTVEERTESLGAGLADGRSVARALGERHGVWGDLTRNDAANGEIRLQIQRPGTATEAVYRSASGETRLKTQRAPLAGLLVALHHGHGVTHESAWLNLWGALVGIVSAGLVVLGATGVYLWFKLHEERVAGAIVLALSLGISVSAIVLIRLAQ
jgi:hypothetical protein